MVGKGHRSPVLVIVATLNEEEGIGLTISELRQYLDNPRILVVDGKSNDKTVKVAKNLNVEVMFQQGKGKGKAIAQAIREIDDDANYVVFTDADYTYPAEFLPRMIRILEENPQVGMVCGNRFNLHFRLEGMSDIFYLGNRLLAFTHNMLNGINLRDPLTGLRIVRADILKGWKPKSAGFDIEVELNHRVERRGFGTKEISIPYRPRLGEKKLKLKDGASILRRIILEAY